MKLLNPTLTTNSISALPRAYHNIADTYIILREDGSNKIETITPSSITSYSNNIVFNCEFTILKEGSRYTITIYQEMLDYEFDEETQKWSETDTTNVSYTKTIFKDTCFATTKNSETYSINDGKFEIDEDEGTNEYIIDNE